VLSRNGKSVAHAYQERVAAGQLIDDPAQRQAALTGRIGRGKTMP